LASEGVPTSPLAISRLGISEIDALIPKRMTRRIRGLVAKRAEALGRRDLGKAVMRQH
jgi:hypothetical protein